MWETQILRLVLRVRVCWLLQLLKQSEGHSVRKCLESIGVKSSNELLSLTTRDPQGVDCFDELGRTMESSRRWYLWLLCSYYRPHLDWEMWWTNVGRCWTCWAGFLRLNLPHASTRGRNFDNMVIHTTMYNSLPPTAALVLLYLL